MSKVYVVRDLSFIVGVFSSKIKAEKTQVNWINDHFVPESFRNQIYISDYELDKYESPTLPEASVEISETES